MTRERFDALVAAEWDRLMRACMTTEERREDLTDSIAETIQDAEGPDSNSYTAARAVVEFLEARGLINLEPKP